MGDIYEGIEGIGDSLLGNPSKDSIKNQQKLLENAQRIPMELWDTTSGIRKNVTGMLENFTGGNMDITSQPMFAPGKSAIEDTYKTGRQNILETMPEGGMLYSGLAGLEGDRAKGLTDVIAKIQQDVFDKAYGAGYGTPQTSITGLNQAALTSGDALNTQSAAAAQNAAGIGRLLGTIITK
jgi:hypothetical protein